ncbi:MAG: FAD-binding protein [Solirubrobacterales bacterium]
MDMEMIQYHPTTLAGKGFLITEGAQARAHLLNARGERFMERYAPNKMELASRDVVSGKAARQRRAVAEQTEINEGRGFPGRHRRSRHHRGPAQADHEALRNVLVGRDFAGVDITREPIHIKPGNHYTMGGVKTDIWGRTNVPGLYAAGEVACVSVHGGNRLGANSLLDTLIFGRRCGEDGAQHAKGHGFGQVSRSVLSDAEARVDAIIARAHEGGRRVSEIKAELGATMDAKVAVFRDAEGIQSALETVRRLKEEATSAYVDDRSSIFNQDVLAAIELQNMLENAEACCMAALERRESRGAQYRTDYPERNDEEWLKHIDVTLEDGEPKISYSPVTITDWQPQERTY